jgi:hypothetical protein
MVLPHKTLSILYFLSVFIGSSFRNVINKPIGLSLKERNQISNSYEIRGTIYSVINKDGLKFVRLYFKIGTSDKYDINYI